MHNNIIINVKFDLILQYEARVNAYKASDTTVQIPCGNNYNWIKFCVNYSYANENTKDRIFEILRNIWIYVRDQDSMHAINVFLFSYLNTVHRLQPNSGLRKTVEGSERNSGRNEESLSLSIRVLQ